MSFSSKNKIEILAPSGSREQLTAAVRSGADAVYLGAGAFNARRNAENFSSFGQLREAVEYCHDSGVEVHLASNILVRDDEWSEAEDLLETACKLGIDAMIVQDVGLARYIRACAPDMIMHASTQMSLHTPHGAVAAADMGFRRAVLSRELSKAEIAEITAVSPIETEVFVHGALCMSVSGQCLFSSVLGGRSGNRGLCAQPCRLPFKAVGDRSGFDGCMSLKDMSHISHIPELIGLGVNSIKIEGRMKRPEYVAAAVTACRLMRDEGEVPSDLWDKLTAVFSRSGFTDGYFAAKRGRGMFGKRTKDDVVSASSALFNSLHPLYKNEFQRIPLSVELTAPDITKPAVLTVSDNSGNCITVNGEYPQQAVKAPFSEEYGARILGKTGGTPYYLDKFTAKVGEGLTFVSSQLSAMKRDALEQLSTARRAPKGIEFSRNCIGSETSPRREFGCEAPKLRVVFRSAEQIPSDIDGVEMAYIPLETEPSLMKYAADMLTKRGIIPAVEAPRGLFGEEDNILKMAISARKLGINDIMIHNVGLLPALAEVGMNIHGGFGLNVFNSRALDESACMGLIDNELSYELTLNQAAALESSQPRGLIIRGRIPMMLTRNCPAAASPKGCSGIAKEGGICGIIDRTGKELPVICRSGCSEIFNPVMMSVVENVAGKSSHTLSLDWVTLRFTDEDDEQCSAVINEYTSGNIRREAGITAGLYFKGVL